LDTLKQIASPTFLEKLMQFSSGKSGFQRNKLRFFWEKIYLLPRIRKVVVLASLDHLTVIGLMGIQRLRISRPRLIGLFSALI
jgi:hypothetical protein